MKSKNKLIKGIASEIDHLKGCKKSALLFSAIIVMAALVVRLVAGGVTEKLSGTAFLCRVPSVYFVYFLLFIIYVLSGIAISIIYMNVTCRQSTAGKCLLDILLMIFLSILWYPVLYAAGAAFLGLLIITASALMCVFSFINSVKMYISLSLILFVQFLIYLFLIYINLMFIFVT